MEMFAWHVKGKDMKVLKFEASWCQPCKQLSRVIESAKDKLPLIEAIDIDTSAELAKQYSIRGVPTLVLVDDQGTEIKRKSGFMREAELLTFVMQE